MSLRIFLFFALIFDNIKGIEEFSEAKSKLNDFITINENINFTINTEYSSIAYFDSIDKNCLVFIKEERIDGQFYSIPPGIDYIISVKLYNPELTCVLQRYLSSSSQIVRIEDNSINHLYLRKEVYYTVYFENNNIDRIFTLSKKNIDVQVSIGACQLNYRNFYCKIDKEDKRNRLFISKVNDAFIEIINVIQDDDYQILDKEYYELYDLESKNTILTIPYTQKNIEIELMSFEPFKFSFANGFNNNNKFYYNSISNANIEATKEDDCYINTIKFYDLYRNVSLLSGEFFSFSINIEKNEDQIVFLNYKQTSEIDELMDENLEESYCEDVIKNLKDIFEIYVFSDIAKDPPEIDGIPNYHHEKIDFQQRLSSISTKNRKFYEFYQEIELILGSVRDGHLNIIAKETPLLTKISQYYAVLPFDFKIMKYQENDYRIFITYNNYYYYNYDEKIRQIIDKNKKIPIKRINRINPFDYIQNWSKFSQLKNIHATFTNGFSQISYFYLFYHPLNYSDLCLNEYEFDNGDILRIPYSIKKPLLDNLEFDNYFLNILKSIGSIKEIPPFNSIYNSFLVFKGLKKGLGEDENKTIIDWDSNLSHIERYDHFKCRIDHINKVNVIYQNSFAFKYYMETIGKILKCAKAFLSNKYPIIIIESNNGGGYVRVLSVLLQAIQPRIEYRDYSALRVTSLSKYQYLNKYDFNKNIDYYDCSEINNFSDFKRFYKENYGSSSVSHIRTSAYDSLSIPIRFALKEFRKEVINNENLKRPTDIIVFTDSYSFSATSSFIKSLQNSGGAVIVGYFGNPRVKGTTLFDASQSASGVDSLSGTQMKAELEKKGFLVNGVTVKEKYDSNPDIRANTIPMEYTFNPVDFRVDIFSSYSDDIYDQFIQEGLKIHKKLNEENKCNSKNNKLIFHDEKSCYNGGYKCKSDNTWDKSRCYNYYCKIGYYFDQTEGKCIENCKFDKIKSFFIYEDNFNKIYDIQYNTRYYFYFPFIRKKNYFFSNDFGGMRIPVTYYELIIPELPFNYKLKIEEIKTNIKLIKLDNTNTKISSLISRESLIFIKNFKDYILYLDNNYNSSKTKYKIAEYNNQMSNDEILNQDTKYFSDYKESIHFFSKDKMYLLYISVSELDPFNLFIGPSIKEETIEINGYETNFLYLEKDKVYSLDFRKNSINRMIKLSRETLKSVVTIINKSFVLNSKNLYYQLDDNYRGKLTLKIEIDNALIEFLFKQEDSEIDVLRFNKKQFILKKKYNIMAIPKSYLSKLINIDLNKNEFLTKLNIYFGYSIPPYNYFSTEIEENIITMDDSFSFTINEHYKEDNIDLMEDEYYCVMIESFAQGVLMNINVKE